MLKGYYWQEVTEYSGLWQDMRAIFACQNKAIPAESRLRLC
jgi:hypothetical protein